MGSDCQQRGYELAFEYGWERQYSHQDKLGKARETRAVFPPTNATVSSEEDLISHLMVEHLKELASPGTQFFSFPTDSGIEACVSPLATSLTSKINCQPSTLESEKLVKPERRFFTFVKMNPGSWHTVNMSPAAGHKLNSSSLLASMHSSRDYGDRGPLVFLDPTPGTDNIVVMTALNRQQPESLLQVEVWQLGP